MRLLAGVTLDELYVVPVLQEERRFVSLGEEAQALLNELRAPDLPPERQRKIMARLARLEHLRWDQSAGKGEPERLQLSAAFGNWRHWVVLGTPGAGKSTLLQFLAGKCADEAQQPREQHGLTSEKCPLLFPLREYAQARQQHGNLSLSSFLVARFAGTDRALQVAVQSALAQGEALVLLDALDEVANEHERRAISHAITNFLATYPTARCIITSRPYGYEPVAGDVIHLRLPHFSSAEVSALIHRRQGAIESRRPKPDLGYAASTARDIISQIEHHKSVAELARNPLLLVMICELCQRGQRLPVERAQLYDRAIRTLLRRWNQWRAALPDTGSDATANGAPLDEETLVRAFGEVALRQQRSCHSRPVMHQERLERWLGQALRRCGMLSAAAKATARSYVHAAADRAGLLEERGPKQFVFWHQTLQEYLAATCLTRDPKRATQRLLRVADQARWHEVIQLTLANLGQVQDQPKRATRAVQALLTKCLPPLDGATHQRLCLAASCLAHNPWLGTKVADAILTRLAQALLVLPLTPLAKSFEEAARARPGLMPSAALSGALAALCYRDYGYIGNSDVTAHAARILSNGTSISKAALACCRRLLQNGEKTDDKQHGLRRASGDVLRARCSAALGLLRAGGYAPSVLIAVSTVMKRDQMFITDVETQLKALRSHVEPLLDLWLCGEGPSLDVAAAILLSFLDRHDATVIDVLLREIRRGDYRLNDIGAYSLLHWHANHSSEARSQLLSHLPELRDRNSDALTQLMRSLARDSDAFLADLTALLADPESLVERVLLWRDGYEPATEGLTVSRVLEQLRPLLQASDVQVCYRAACILEALGHPELATAALLECLQRAPPEMQLSAAERLLTVDPDYRLDYFSGYGYPQIKVCRDPKAIEPIVADCLRQLLRSDIGVHRVRAAAFLVKLGHDDEDAVVDVLSSADALRLIERYRHPHFIAQHYSHRLPQLAERMAEHIGSMEPAVRSAAQDWLAWFPSLHPPVLNRLRAYLASPIGAIRFAAAAILFRTKAVDASVQIALIQSIASLSAHQTGPFTKSLQEVAEPAPEAVSLLIENLLRSADSAQQSCRAESEHLDQTGKSASGERPERLMRIANEVHDRDLAQILIAWSHRSVAVVEAVVDKLVSLLRAPRPNAHFEIALHVIHRLIAEHDHASPKPLVEALAARFQDETDLGLLFLIAEKFFFLGYCITQAHAALRRCLESPNLRIRFEAAARLMPESGTLEPAVSRALFSCLETSDVRLRWRVALQLGRDTDSSHAVIAALKSLLAVEEWGEQEHLFDLAFIDRDEHGCFFTRSAGPPIEEPEDALHRQLRYLERLVGDRNQAKPLCVLAASQLLRLDDDPANNPLLNQTLLSWLEHPDPARRVRALRYLLGGRDWSPEPKVESVLLAWLDAERWQLRQAAALLLHRRADKRSLVEDRLGRWLANAGTANDEPNEHLWNLAAKLAEQSDPLLRILVQRYLDYHGADWQAERRLSLLAKTQLERITTVIDGALRELPLNEAVFAVYLMTRLGGTTPAAMEVVVKAWADQEQAPWPVEQLLNQLAEGYPEFSELILPYLDDSMWWRREGAVSWLLQWGYDHTPLAGALRTGLHDEDPAVRYSACRRLLDLDASADRPAIVAALGRLISEAPSVYATSECLRPFREWPEFADTMDAVYIENLKDGVWFDLGSIIKHFLGRPQHLETLRLALHKIAVTGHFRDATVAVGGLRKLGIDRRSLLRIVLTWLTNGDGGSSLQEEACKRLHAMGLLTEATTKEWRDYDIFGARRILDGRMEEMLSLAKSPLVPLILAEQIRLDLVPPVERCVKGVLQAGDEEALADAVRTQERDSSAQRFARCWMFYWLRQRAKVLRPQPLNRPAAQPSVS